jgi:hypothetical protein
MWPTAVQSHLRILAQVRVNELMWRHHPPEVIVAFSKLKISANGPRSPGTIAGCPDAVDLDAIPFVA